MTLNSAHLRLGGIFAALLSCLISAAPAPVTMTLEACLAAAQENNHRHPASQFAVAVAEAQHRQALSGYWPRITLSGGLQRLDEAPDFLFPASIMGVPGQTVTTPASTAFVTVPAGVLGPTEIQLPVSVPAQTITTQPQLFNVPPQDVKVLNRDSATVSADLKWLLFDGGMRRGLDRQTSGLVETMKQAARRTDLEIADSVRCMYYGAVLARQLHRLGDDTLARMEATLSLTETMYQGGGGRVTKADFLDNKILLESIRALVASLEKNDAMAQAALANTLGLPWDASVVPADEAIPFAPFGGRLDELVGSAYRFNPDWQSFEAGLGAAEGAVQTARSGRYPRVALTGDLHRWQNGYDAGLATPANKSGWSLTLGFEVPLFDGRLTRSKIAEMKARLAQLHEQGFLLKEGIALQIKDNFLGLAAADKACAATRSAMEAATENRDLNTRAYQQELVDTEKVIRAQLMEAVMTAQHLKARYDHVALASHLSLTVGRELVRQLKSSP